MSNFSLYGTCSICGVSAFIHYNLPINEAIVEYERLIKKTKCVMNPSHKGVDIQIKNDEGKIIGIETLKRLSDTDTITT